MTPTPASLNIQNLTIKHGRKKILRGFHASLDTGLTLLTGRSGSGKSSLLRVLATADKAAAGDLFLDQRSIRKDRRSFRRVLGYAPQSVDLPEDLTAQEFLQHMAALKELDRSETAEQIIHLAEHLELTPDLKRQISTFSGGMRRRLILMQALLGEPRCLLLDEPTAELDPVLIERTVTLLEERRDSAVIVVATHLAGAFAASAPRILSLDAIQNEDTQ